MRTSMRARIVLSDWGVRVALPISSPLPTPKLMGCTVMAPPTTSNATVRLSSGMLRPSIWAP